jgi:hypothetical protein
MYLVFLIIPATSLDPRSERVDPSLHTLRWCLAIHVCRHQAPPTLAIDPDSFSQTCIIIHAEDPTSSKNSTNITQLTTRENKRRAHISAVEYGALLGKFDRIEALLISLKTHEPCPVGLWRADRKCICMYKTKHRQQW